MFDINILNIETFLDDKNKFIPYCTSYNIKKNHFSQYFEKNEDDLIEKLFENFFDMIIKDVYIYVHNLDFSGLLILSSLTKNNNFKYEILVRKMSFYKIKFFKEQKKINLICSYKIFPISLKQIEPYLTSLHKLPFPYLFSKRENLFFKGSIPEIHFWDSESDYKIFCQKNSYFNFKEYSIEHCLNNIKIVSFFMNKIKNLIKEFKINLNVVHSGPSLALKIFISNFNKSKVSFSSSPSCEKIAKQSYYGGRCEIYGNPLQSELIFHYDFIGMYAQCMSEKFGIKENKIKTENLDVSRPGFYWINFESNIERPVLPVHIYGNNKLIFPNGKNLTGCFWFEEIILFLNCGGKIKKILYGAEYDKFDYVFKDYVCIFTKIKEKEGGVCGLFAKNMINFLYGRMGLAEPDEHTFFIKVSEFENINFWKNYNIKNILKINDMYMISIELDNNVKKDFNLSKAKFVKNIGLAASITSKARIKLYTEQTNVENNGGRLLYSDTDSIIAAYADDVINQTHGKIFWDGSKKDTIIKNAVFADVKSYALKYPNGEEVIKIKGFRDKYLKYDNFEESFYDKKTLARETDIISKKSFYLFNQKIEKNLNLSKYEKRVFSNNLKKTSPIFYEPFM